MKLALQNPAGRIGAAVASGVLFYFVFGLKPCWWAAWLAPIPLLVAAFHASGREARALAWLAAAIGLTSQFAYYGRTTGPVAAVIIVILQLLLWGFIVGRTRAAVLAYPHGLTILVYPLIVAAADTLISFFSPHGTAGSLAFGQMDFLPVVQIASVLGAPGIVFLVSLFSSTLAVALYRGRGISRPWLAYGVTAAILLFALGWGAFHLLAAVAGPTVRVGLVALDDIPNPNTPPDHIWAAYDQLVRELATQGARIIVLPEKVFQLEPDEAASRRKQFAALARETAVNLVVGMQLNQPDRKRNVSWLLTPVDGLVEEYDKQHMVPHLESDLTPGREIRVHAIGGEPYGLVICRDMFFPGLGRAYARRGVTALLIPAWDFYVDAWWASRVAALRGVEGGYSVVRASREGFLTVSDQYGRFLAEKRSDYLPGVSLLATLSLRPATPTPYARWGDVFGWLCVAGALPAILLPGRRRRSSAHDLTKG